MTTTVSAPAGTSPIARVFAERRSQGRAALVPYVTAGFPHPDATVEVLEAIVDAGADVLELGVPFSDPLADGPTIQLSSYKALQQGTTVRRTLEMLAAFRALRATPVVLFTYLNPVLRYGVDAFCADAVEAGAQGVLLTDLPAGADPELEERVRGSGLDLIRLIAPTTSPDRIARIAEGSTGFLYYISRLGVTGAREALRAGLEKEIGAVRAQVSLPVAVGFGISTPAQAATVAAVADGVVVGSALVNALDAGGAEGARGFVASLRAAMDGVAS